MKLIAVFLLLASAAVSQTVPPSASAGKNDDYSQEPYVIESQRTVYRFENDGTGRKEASARIRVQSEAGVELLGQLIFGYNSANESMQIPYVRVLKSDGTVVTASASAIQDLTAPVAREAPVYTDYHQKHVTVPGLRPGEVLEYQVVTTISTALAPGEFWMEHHFFDAGIVLDDQLEVNIPRDRAVKLKTRAGREPTIIDLGDRRIYRWASSHTQREDEDTDKTKKKRKVPPEPPDVQMTTFASWESLGAWYASLERDRRQPSAAVRARAEELVKGRTTEMDKLQAIYDYVAKNFRYVSLSFGVGRYQPHSADEVLSNQYGDCKDKHTLLEGLLEAVGIRASSVLINSKRALDPDIPSPSQFDHMISLVPVGKEMVWLDTTTEIAPFRLITYNLRKKKALVIPPDGPAKLVETPADAIVANSQVVDTEGKVSDLGKLTAHVRLAFSGDSELPLRIGFRQVPSARWKDLAQVVAQLEGLRGDISNLRADDPSDNRGPFHLEFDIAQPNFLDWSKRQSQLDLPLAHMRLPDLSDADEHSSTPIEIGAPGSITVRLKIELPSTFTARAPLPFEMKRDYGEYRAAYDLQGNTFSAERAMILRAREIPAARLRDYAAFRRAIVADEGQQLALDNTQPGTPKPPANVKVQELYEAGLSALQAQNYRGAAELLERVVELEPQHKTAWNDLGNAYLAQRRTDEAIQAFNKQVEINPFDEFAFNNLGRAWWDKRDYAKAAESFNIQIDVNPLDKFAHRNLGIMYLEEHKNREALPELEKATSLNPQDAQAFVSLGQARLELGDDDKALAAFDRAVKIAPAPGIWNNIAYQLSLKKVHLDLAQQYAESAVASTAAALRNLTADSMQLEQQALVIELAAQWDTLGWVYFQRGNLDKAEQYIGAAWLLGQHGEVGDHLAQIYEKRGEREKSIATYAQALAAYKPLPETRPRLAALLGHAASSSSKTVDKPVKNAAATKVAGKGSPQKPILDLKIDALVEKGRRELEAMRTVGLGPLVKESAQADFYLVVGPGPKVEDVRFISGSDQLKPFTDALRAAQFKITFPDSTPTRLLRRGTLSCAPATDCKLMLVPADDLSGTQ
jgi:tetratricopeptide (TPR) repeat protein/transglutaminase-like putative cysteine protease